MKIRNLVRTLLFTAILIPSTIVTASASESIQKGDTVGGSFSITGNIADYEITAKARSVNSENIPGGYWEGGYWDTLLYSNVYSTQVYAKAMIRPGHYANYVSSGYLKHSPIFVSRQRNIASGNRSGYDYHY